MHPVCNFALKSFTLQRQELTSNMYVQCKPFGSLSPIHYLDLLKIIYNGTYCPMFIKFHFTFIQQHFCRQLFVAIWDIFRVNCLVTFISFKSRRRHPFCKTSYYGLLLRVLCHNRVCT